MDDKRKLLLSLLTRASATSAADDGVAIVGVAGRYPLADTVSALWENLAAGRHCVREVPAERWDAGVHHDPSGVEGSYSKWGGFLDGVDQFDPLFFQISPADAEAMDPQERLFLQTAAAVLDDAGHPAARLAARGPVGVFAGVMNSNYEWMGGEATALGARTDAHSNHWSIANRVSYAFDFTGPSMAVDTACSASLTAVHLACESIRSGECQAAIAGGVNLILHPMHLRTLADRGMLSHDDRLKSFGAGADGFVDGEGVGAVLLRPLADALADGDRVLGVIRGSAINAGGKTGGYTVPSAAAQAEVIRSALRRANVEPETIGYVEAHGTGTPLGDPIEIAGLAEAFGVRADPTRYADRRAVPIGSVKSNIGHLESAAGIAGLTKVLLQFRHNALAPSLHSTHRNPEIDFGSVPFEVQQTLQPWPAPTGDDAAGRRALVSSFGGGGANACLVVEAYEPAEPTPVPPGPQLLVLSAKHEERLRAAAGELAGWLRRPSAADSSDVLGQTQDLCLRLAARTVAVEPDFLDLGADLADCGFGMAERAAYHALLEAEWGDDLPPAVTRARTVGEVAAALVADAASPGGSNAPRLADVAHTLQSGRSPYEYRLALTADSVEEAAEALAGYASGRPDARVATGRATRVRTTASAPETRALESALGERDLTAVGAAWLTGREVDWSALTSAGARRIELPGYSFARDRYWIPAPPAAATPSTPPAVSASAPASRESEQTRLPDFYRPLWVPTSAPAPAAARPAGRVLALVTDASRALGEALAARLPEARVDLVHLDREAVPEWLGRAALADLVLHLGGVAALPAEGVGHEEAEEHQRYGSTALLHLLRAPEVRRVAVVTGDVHPVAGSVPTNPFAAGLHGLLRVAAVERPELRLSAVDFASQDLGSGEGQPAVLDALRDHVLAERSDHRGEVLALRGGRWYRRQLGRVELPATREVFRERGVYLLVGGTGGIGQELSLHLARSHRARLVWLSRGEPGPEARETADAVRRAGGEVVHVPGDACALADVSAAVAEAYRRFGALHGAVHAAMAFDDHPLAELDTDTFLRVTRVKTEGAAALAAAVAGRPLDFLAYFSSAGAFGGFAGNGAYACASVVEDAYGHFLRARLDIPVTVVNQGYWGMVGSGARPGLAAMFEGLGISAFGAAEGVAAVGRVLGSGLPQVMPIRATRRALEALGHEPALDGVLLPGGHSRTLATTAPALEAAEPADRAAHGVLAGYAELEAVAVPALLDAYREMGAFRRAGERHRPEELRRSLGIVDRFRRLHVALLNILVDAGLLARDGECYTAVTDAGQAEEARDAAFARIADDHPDIEPTVTLNRLFLQDYPRILRGELGATEIMFPGSSMRLVQSFYKGNPLTDACNTRVHDTLRAFLDARLPGTAPDRRLEVLELGAGTGATSERVLDALAAHPERVGFTFTDISPRFIEHGRERFADRYPFARYQVLNLERELDEQGFEPGSVDLVVATNVVHATGDLRATLRKAKALLAPGGWLVLNELTSVRPLLTVGGGVLEGWWSFDDTELRLPDSPLAAPETWSMLLAEQGFTPVVTAGRDGAVLGQTVLVAESDGVVPAVAQQSPAATPAPTAPVPVPAQDAVAARLRELVERVLKLTEPIDPDRPLADYGFDSLSGMKIVAAVDESFDVAVPLGDFFAHPTLRELAAHLSSAWLDAAPEASIVSEAAPAPAPGGGPVPAATGHTPQGPALDPGTVSRVLRPRTDAVARVHPQSAGQRALWVIEQIAPGNYAYNLPLALWLDPDVRVPALRVVLQDVLDRHEALRSTLHDSADGPAVRVAAEPELPFQHVYLTARTEEELRARMRDDLRQPFDLGTGPLLRATLYTLGDGRTALLLTFHHAVFDGVSIALLCGELERGYRAMLAGAPLPQERTGKTYADFTAWQRELLAGPEGRRLRDYWTGRLTGRRTVVELPLDGPRPAVPGFRGASVDGRVPAGALEALRALARSERTSLFSTVLALWLVLLHRYAADEDVAVGTPTAGRPPSGYDDVPGYFMNMVVLAERIDGDEELRTLVRRVHSTVLEALEHSAYPLLDLAAELGARQPGGGAAPFNVAFYFQNWSRDASSDEAGALLAGPVEGVHQEGEFDLTLEIVEEDEGARYTLKYDPDLLHRATVERIGRHFTTLLAAAEDPAALVGSLDPLTPQERAPLAGPTTLEGPADSADSMVWELVGEQASARPETVAVRYGDTAVTYRQLAQQVDELAGRLTAAGVGRGRTVGVLLPRDARLPVALLAVQAAGGAYVPLDPSYPSDRLAYMVQDAGLHLLLTHSQLAPPPGDVPRLCVDGGQEPPARPSPGPAGPQDPAYVIYTSGSTGRPKGVQVPHRALANFLWSMAREPGFGPGDTFAALTTVCFDISALELYLPLVTGGTVEVLATEDTGDGHRLRAALERSGATVAQATPATWTMLLAAGWRGDPALTVLCGGEALPGHLAEQLLSGNRAVWNLYGPTETTIWSTVSRLSPGEPVDLGAPIAHTTLHVLDRAGRPVPTGAPGELYIGGRGVADGYLGRPELTAERFLPDPYGEGPDARIYRTGDLVRRTADGGLEYLGRIDTQVKVRGFRIELEEIEETLRREAGVSEAVVVARGQEAGSHTLLACCVLDDGVTLPAPERLARWLPEHMVPDALVQVVSFPQTLNGKIDRTTLATLPLPELRSRYGAEAELTPYTEEVAQSPDGVPAPLSRVLAELVAELTGTRAVDLAPHTPLGEAGMNSVGFTTLSARLRRDLGIEVAPTLFYRRGTLAALAAHLWEHHRTELVTHLPELAATSAAGTAAPGQSSASAADTRDRAAGPSDSEVAILGMAARLPGSHDLDAFWEHLLAGNDLVTEVPTDRWKTEGGPVRHGGFAPGVDRFDAAFFGISPREAELMDPQQRLILEVVWSAVENAGYRPSQLAGKRVGVFLAATNSDYPEVQRQAGGAPEGHSLTGAALSIIPNRVSYLLDLRGPSIAVDTACSGSLTAVHQACAALRAGDCDLALAGGVSLMLSPTVHEALEAGEMLSADGRCKAFDSRADGYVRGEGAGVVLLKPNHQATRDGDAVHAVIKAAAIQHGGRTTSLTAPNPDSQADLLVEAYRAADVPVDTIGYIEAHGTGTALGDPIETAGLSTAFRRLRGERSTSAPPPEPCLVGSVKTNIGHLEAAAGVAGLLKAVLVLRHGTVPASLHFREQNPLLELDGGPFQVASTTRPWPRRSDAAGADLPRRAGVSAFGFGGAGAHIVLEEATMPDTRQEPAHTQAFVLSARDEDALSRSVRRLADHLGDRPDLTPADLAYTLQTGREPMAHRLAVLATDTGEVRAELLAYLDGRTSTVRTGRADAPDATAPPAAGEDVAALTTAWLTGAAVDWLVLHRDARRRRVHLPSYPFDGPRHWVQPATPSSHSATATAGGSAATALHPTLLDANVSTLGEQIFTKTLTGREFFLRDHVVDGVPVLPGVAFLDMGRLAGELATGGIPVRGVDGLVWAAPVRLTDAAAGPELRVRVTGDRAHAAFEVRGTDPAELVHCHGTLVLGELPSRPAPLDLTAIRARCSRTTEATHCYADFTRLGFRYGPALRALEEIAEGPGEVLAALRIPAEARPGADSYVFHPALLDAALQAAGRLAPATSGADGDAAPYLPYSIGAVRLYAPLPERVYAHAVPSPGPATEGVLRFDVALLTPAGEVAVTVDSFALRAVPAAALATARSAEAARSAGSGEPEVRALIPTWKSAPATTDRRSATPSSVLLLDGGGDDGGTARELTAAGLRVRRVELGHGFDAAEAVSQEGPLTSAGEPPHVVHLAGPSAGTREAVEHGFHAALAFLREWRRARREPLRYLYVHSEPATSPADPAMGAFLRSVRRELPSFDCGVLSVAGATLGAAVLEELRAEDGFLGEVRRTSQGRSRRTWQPLALPRAGDSPFGGAGAHLVTGGTGALGLLVAAHIAAARRAAGITTGGIVLAQRGEPDAATRARAATLGAVVVRADVADPDDVAALVAEARRRYGAIRGVMHAAGVLRDGLLAGKERTDADAVLAAKVHGTALLDEATRGEPLDYFVAFSSASAVFGNVGQTDYAFANAYLGHFAEQREARRVRGERAGRTLAAAWPVWAEGGMRVDAAAQAYMERVLGMRPVPTDAGMDAMDRALATGAPYVLLAPGDPDRIVAALADEPGHRDLGGAAVAAADSTRENAEALVLRLLAEELKLPEDEIVPTEPFDRHGVDSLITMGLVRRLEEHVGPLSKTLLFEYVTVRQLAEHLAAEHPAAFAVPDPTDATPPPAAPASTPPPPPATEAVPPPATEASPAPATEASPAPATEASPAPATAAVAVTAAEPTMSAASPAPVPAAPASRPAEPAEPVEIAVIGVAGRYPQADDVEEFWANLREGRDSVEEVPSDRWDHSLFYDPDRSATGKTYGKWGGFVRGADRFDPMFFRMSQIEAEHTDPQERVFLETVWHLLEDAGYTREQLRSARTGVFVGMMYGHYQLYGVQEALRGTGFATSSSYASVANRVSYFFDFTGPSVALDTMCSSSLVTVHQACQAIRDGDCEVAVAGGVNISSHPVKLLQLAQRGFLAEDGRCRSFGDGGTGYVPAEGSGAVLLKRLDAARADGDRILAVVKSSAVNHGGSGAGYSVPNPTAQGDLIRSALKRAGLRAADLDYLEAHGTGTALGDPVEVNGVLRAFGEDAPEQLPIGSVKSNIGHAESAAGVAAITKVLLQMRHGELAPSLHAEHTNPNIDFGATPLRVQRHREPWPRRLAADGTALPRTAGVSSFGAGGTNAHLIFQEHLEDEPSRTSELPAGPYVAVLSARDADGLLTQARRLATRLSEAEQGEFTPARVSWTLQTGREAMAHRFAVLFDDLPELVDRLLEFAAGVTGERSWAGVVDPRRPAKGEHPAAEPAACARAWTLGLVVDWTVLHSRHRPRRVSLPGYPFRGDRVWLAAADAELAALRTESPAADGVLLTRRWEPAGTAAQDALPARTAVLVPPGAEALSAGLVALLPGAEALTPDRLAADLADPGTRWDRFDAVVDLAGCVPAPLPADHGGLPVWWRWLQRVVDHTREGLRLLLVTHDPSGDGRLTGGAPRVGLYRMLQSEYRQLRSRHLTVRGATEAETCRSVVAELRAGDEAAEVLHRDGVRHLGRLAEQPSDAGQRRAFPPGHVLWVTGGTRGLGLRTAQHFVARHGVRKLVLTGREELPPRDQWAARVSQGGPLADKLRPLAELVDSGVQLEVVAVPLEEREALAKTLTEVRRRLGPVGGVVHSAGYTDFANPAFVRKPEDGLAKVLGPKIPGVDNLLEAFRDERPAFVVLYSSVAAVLPALAVGQSDYAMANAYLDAVAQARPYGLPVVSVQWPSWRESGMGEARSAAYRASGLASLTDEEGLALLDRALESGARVVLPALPAPGAKWDPLRLTDRRLEDAPTPPVAQAVERPVPTGGSVPTGALGAAVSAASSWLLDHLSEELRFDRDRLTGDVPVHDYGMDSIMVTQLVQNVAGRLQVSVDPSALLEHPTVDEFVAHLAEQHEAELLAAFGPQGGEPTPTPGEAPAHAVQTPSPTPVPPTSAPPTPATSAPAPPAVVTAAPTGATAVPVGRPAEEIAVVGLACRFPGAESADAYWQLLRDGRSALRPIPETRFGRPVDHRAGLLPDELRFDADAFLLPEQDVRAMDPQALLLLEEVWTAMHHAGYRPADLKGRQVGVYVGGRATHPVDPDLLTLARNPVVVTGQNYLAGNVSQFFDLQGPSLVVDTACSSALVAMEAAVRSLTAGDIEAAVVAGVNLLGDDRAFEVFGQRGLLSPDGEFRVFDQRAAGLVLGEGVGAVMLKPLSAARAAGDRVLAVIEGIAVNNDGRTAGPATPNVRAQKAVMAQALARSGRTAESVGWLEANGSGSVVTDLLELKAVEQVYRAGSRAPLSLGSVKPNIGHPLAAEGIAAFIKVVLMLHHGQRVPFLSGQVPPTHFDLDKSALRLPRMAEAWPEGEVAVLNCFADGGTNAHVVMAPAGADLPAGREPLSPPSLNRTVTVRGTVPPAGPGTQSAGLFWDEYR